MPDKEIILAGVDAELCQQSMLLCKSMSSAARYAKAKINAISPLVVESITKFLEKLQVAIGRLAAFVRDEHFDEEIVV